MSKNCNIALVKHVEYFDGVKWCPLIWYSNRKDNDFESLFEGPDMVEHSEIFYNAFKELSDIIKTSPTKDRGIPDDISDFLKDKIKNCPCAFYGASYYYINELKERINKEEALLVGELKNGVEIKLFDDNNIVKTLIGDDIEYKEDSEDDKGRTIKVIKTIVRTVEQLKYIANIVTKLVYEVHGFVEDDKIRVIYYYKE